MIHTLAVKWMENLSFGIFVTPVLALSIDVFLYKFLLKKTDIKKAFKLFTIVTFALAFTINYAWELLQGPLYEGYRYTPSIIAFCGLASIADAIMTLLLYFGFAVVYKSPLWIQQLTFTRLIFLMLVGSIGAILSEIRHISEGNWSYNEQMPVIPIFEVGLTPILQFIMLPILIYFISYSLIKKKIGSI